MKRTLLFLLLASALSLATLACARAPRGDVETPTPAAPTPSLAPPTPDPVSERLLNPVGCTMPCWEGIVPGVTTFDEAATIVNQTPKFSRQSAGYGFLRWEGPGYSATFTYDQKSEVVRAVSVDPVREINMRSMWERYGDPSHVYFNVFTDDAQMMDEEPSPSVYAVSFAFVEHSFVLEWITAFNSREMDDLMERGRARSIHILSPAPSTAAFVRELYSDSLVVPWDPTFTMREYCIAAFDFDGGFAEPCIQSLR